MKILAIIPARKGSKRVPGKNTKLLNGKPLVDYTLKACANASVFSEIVVSSDDESIEPLVAQYKNIAFIRRPDELSTDESLAIDYVKHSLAVKNAAFDIVVIVQPTTPFATSDDINATVQLLIDNPDADSAVSVMQIQQLFHPYKLKTMKGKKLEPFLVDEKGIIPAQQLPDVFVRNGAIYATRTPVIQRGEIIGETCLGYVMPFERSVDINYLIDFEFAEFLAAKYNL